MLKQIPNESPDEIRKKVARKARRFIAMGPGFSANVTLNPKMKRKYQAETNKDCGIMKNVCVKMIQFIRGEGKRSHEQVTELIHGLQRSVLSLERERRRMLQNEKKKNNGR
jgi:transposase